MIPNFGFIKCFNMYDKGISFANMVKSILRPKHYIWFIFQVLAFALLALPHFLTVNNWLAYNLVGLILFPPTEVAFIIEGALIICLFDYYYIFPRLSENTKEHLRELYKAKSNRKLG